MPLKMWRDLPVHILLFIVSLLKCSNDRLAVSTTCKRWRDILFHDSDTVLKTAQRIEFTCGETGRCTTDNDLAMMIKFSRHIETLALTWCVCKTEALLCMLSTLLEHSFLYVKQIRMISNTKHLGFCNLYRFPFADIRQRKQELFLSMIKKCGANLTVLDFGLQQYFLRNPLLMSETAKSIDKGALRVLNITDILHRPTGETPDAVSNELHRLTKLETLCLNWHKTFIDLMHILSSCRNSEINLKNMVVVVYPFCTDGLESSVSSDQWAKIAEYHPRLKLTIIMADDNNMGYSFNIGEQMQNLADHCCFIKSVSLVSLDARFGIQSRMFKYLTKCGFKVEELSIHCGDKLHKCSLPDSFICQDLYEKFPNLKKFEISGRPINESLIIDIGRNFGGHLKDFIVYQRDVVRSCDSRNHFLSEEQINSLENMMSNLLGKKWRLKKGSYPGEKTGSRTDSDTVAFFQHLCNTTINSWHDGDDSKPA